METLLHNKDVKDELKGLNNRNGWTSSFQLLFIKIRKGCSQHSYAYMNGFFCLPLWASERVLSKDTLKTWSEYGMEYPWNTILVVRVNARILQEIV